MSDYPAIACAENVLGLMAAKLVAPWAHLEMLSGLVIVKANNPNMTAGECEERVLAPLRYAYPGGHEQHIGGSMPGRTKRDVRDAWRYSVRLGSDECHADHVAGCYCAQLLVHFPRPHTEHTWVPRLIRRRSTDPQAQVQLQHVCDWCGREASAAQAAAAKLPALAWPS